MEPTLVINRYGEEYETYFPDSLTYEDKVKDLMENLWEESFWPKAEELFNWKLEFLQKVYVDLRDDIEDIFKSFLSEFEEDVSEESLERFTDSFHQYLSGQYPFTISPEEQFMKEVLENESSDFPFHIIPDDSIDYKYAFREFMANREEYDFMYYKYGIIIFYYL